MFGFNWITKLLRRRHTSSSMIADAYRQAGVPLTKDDRDATPADLAKKIHSDDGPMDPRA